MLSPRSFSMSSPPICFFIAQPESAWLDISILVWRLLLGRYALSLRRELVALFFLLLVSKLFSSALKDLVELILSPSDVRT